MTTKSGMAPVHPGEILREELNELGLSASALARAIDVPVNRVTAILNGDRGITADTALRLGRYFDTTSQFWLNLQQAWQIRKAEMEAGAQIQERVISRQTKALREAARTIREMQHLSTPTLSAFRAIEGNLALCDQLRVAEQSFHFLHENSHLLRAFESSLEELRSAGVFETALCENLTLTRQWLADYNKRFQRPAAAEIARLMAELQTTSELIRQGSEFQRAIESIESPWLDVNNKLGSVQRLLELRDIGELISQDATFDAAVAENLRTNLGDWRDAITWPDEIWTDFGARAKFYTDLGFDPDLTDMPAPAFREAAATTIQSEPPSLVNAYRPPEPLVQPGEEAESLSRTRSTRDWLQRLESQLRQFIDTEMTGAFGADWPRHELPDHKYDEWKSKQETAGRPGESSCPLVAYADFNDYVQVVCKRDNWEQVFGRFFERRETIRESLQRLQPIRNDTMHARPITQHDELLLHVESKRIMRCIAA